MADIIETKDAPAPIGPYSQGVRANGFVFVSGQIPIRPETGQVAEGNITEQTHQVLKNLAAVLHAAGTDLGKVVKTTVFDRNLSWIWVSRPQIFPSLTKRRSTIACLRSRLGCASTTPFILLR